MNINFKYVKSVKYVKFDGKLLFPFGVGDKVAINGRLCWLTQKWEKAIRVRSFSQEVNLPLAALSPDWVRRENVMIDGSGHNCYIINDWFDMSPEQDKLFGGSMATVNKLHEMYNGRSEFEVLRVGHYDGFVSTGLTPAGFLDDQKHHGTIIWIDLVDGEWLENGGLVGFVPSVYDPDQPHDYTVGGA